MTPGWPATVMSPEQRSVREDGVAVGPGESRGESRGTGHPKLLEPAETEQCPGGGAALRCDGGLHCRQMREGHVAGAQGRAE